MTAAIPDRNRTATAPDYKLGVESFRNRQEWVPHAKYRNIDPDKSFVRGAAQREAAVVCRHCPMVLQCRADALDNRVEFGIWGGLTERQRRAMLREHPGITLWADFYAEQYAAQRKAKLAR